MSDTFITKIQYIQDKAESDLKLQKLQGEVDKNAMEITELQSVKSDVSDLREEVAGLSKDILYHREDTKKIQAVLNRLMWIVLGGIGAAAIRFVVAGGISI